MIFDVAGDRFGILPDDAVGILAIDNANPLQFIDNMSRNLTFDIVSKDDVSMRLVQQQTAAHSVPSYLGAIVSSDRTKVYWTNTSAPLP